MSDRDKLLIDYKIVKDFRDEMKKYADQLMAVREPLKKSHWDFPDGNVIHDILSDIEVFAIAFFRLDLDVTLTYDMVDADILNFMEHEQVKLLIKRKQKKYKHAWVNAVCFKSYMDNHGNKNTKSLNSK